MADPVGIDASRVAPSSLWDRISTWVSDNKAVAYTIAGTVVVITGAGAVYYFSGKKSDTEPSSPSTEKRKSKKERRKEKKEAEEAAARSGISLKDEEAAIPKPATVEPEDELPDVTEENVETYSREVRQA
jgi:mitochondrial import receptor subunit TOM70